MVREIRWIRAICVHHIDFGIAVSAGKERNLSSIGGPCRVDIE